MPVANPANAVLVALPVILGIPAPEPLPMPAATEPDQLYAGFDTDQRLTLPVSIDGKGPYRFVVDTGSQATVLSTAVANDLQLQRGPDVQIVGVAGRRRAETAWIAHLQFGRQSISPVRAPLLEREHMGADGIVGTDSLQGRQVLSDFAGGRIAIENNAAERSDGYEIVVKARRKLGRLIVTTARIDGVPVDVLVDSGASAAVGNRALQEALRLQNGTASALLGVTGDVLSAQVGTARRLTIGGMAITGVSVAYADAPVFKELKLDKRPALLLGMRELREFRRVAIDFDKRRISFDFAE
jgi:predicted aspartyl protease